MKNKKIIFSLLACILVLFFTACDNSFEPSKIVENNGTNNKPDDDGDGNGDGDETPDIAGINSFTLALAAPTDAVPTNLQFQGLQFIYAGIADTTGDGFEATFTLNIDVPNTIEFPEPEVPAPDEGEPAPDEGEQTTFTTSNEGDTTPEVRQNVKISIGDYVKVEGDDAFPTMYFNGQEDLKNFTITSTSETVTLTVIYPSKTTVQKGSLSIAFEYDSIVYKNTMPRKLLLAISSTGGNVAEASRVVLFGLTEQKDDADVLIHKPDDYVLEIKNKDFEATEIADYPIPLAMNFSGVLPDYPITVTAIDAENLVASDIEVNGGIVTFTATHSGIDKLQLAKGTVTLTVDSDSKDTYKGLPFDIVITTQRDATFEYYAKEFVVSTSTENLYDDVEKKYYTEVRIPGIRDAIDTDMLSYVISRKDDSSSDFKEIDTRTIPAKEAFLYKDYNAFMLRTEPEYKITVTHDACTTDDSCTSEIVKAGSRMLTNRELFLVAMDSMRYALIDQKAHYDVNTVNGANGGTFKHTRWYNSLPISWDHVYSLTNYKPHFMDVTGEFAYEADVGGYQAWEAEDSINTVNGSWIVGQAPFTGTVNFTSPYGNGLITFNSVHITDNNWTNPNWWNHESGGDFSVTVDGEPVTYGRGEVPFGFYMKDTEFLAKLLDESGNYTQK